VPPRPVAPGRAPGPGGPAARPAPPEARAISNTIKNKLNILFARFSIVKESLKESHVWLLPQLPEKHLSLSLCPLCV
jgi:hypothetical protein